MELPNKDLGLFGALCKAKRLDNLDSVLQFIEINGFINLFGNSGEFGFLFFAKGFSGNILRFGDSEKLNKTIFAK